ncbi:MAG: hypothetical protein ACKO54_02525, partial [Alphaproteobacteria bacterium]
PRFAGPLNHTDHRQGKNTSQSTSASQALKHQQPRGGRASNTTVKTRQAAKLKLTQIRISGSNN